MPERATYNLAQIAAIVEGKLYGCGDTAIDFLLTDSRRVVFPQASLFFALQTPQNDGHRYIPELIGKGVKAFVVANGISTQAPGLGFIVVDDPLQALQKLAAYHRSLFHCPVIAITGSNGKTIIKEWLARLLSDAYSVVKSPRSYNSQIGVPLSVWQMDAAHQWGVFEAGISRIGEMANLQHILKPRFGIFTNIGPAHAEGFLNLSQKIREKLVLFQQAEMMIYRCDDGLLAQEIRQWSLEHPAVKLFCWGHHPEADVFLQSVSRQSEGSRVELIYEGQVCHFSIPFTDDASVENAIHVFVCLLGLGLYSERIPQLMQGLEAVAMRLELKQAVNACSLINDSYNSDLYSLGIALDFLRSQLQHSQRTLILSDILQSGTDTMSLYQEVARLVAENQISHFIGIGPAVGQAAPFFQSCKADFFESTAAFLESFDFDSLHHQAILLKGARVFGFERISNRLQLKDHQTVLEINLDALVHNLNVYKAMLLKGVKIMAMVKASSYGSGSYEIASVLQYHQVDYLAVAFADEGKELRQAGIRLPLVVMNPETPQLDILFKYKLEPEVYSLALLRRLASEALHSGLFSADHPFVIHIKLDTGMHRLGFLPAEITEMLTLLTQSPWLRVDSVFSHLAASDMPAHDSFTLQQYARFQKMCGQIREALGYDFLRHLANSAAISRFPELQMDMVRLGIGMYGFDQQEEIQSLLQNVTTFKSVISQIKLVDAGESIGYSRAKGVERPTRIGIVPVGYADGLDRRLSNGFGQLYINGQMAPLIGNVCMDMCMLDLSQVVADEGDEVIIFGKENPVWRLAQQLQTISYEILTSVSARVKRVYFRE